MPTASLPRPVLGIQAICKLTMNSISRRVINQLQSFDGKSKIQSAFNECADLRLSPFHEVRYMMIALHHLLF